MSKIEEEMYERFPLAMEYETDARTVYPKRQAFLLAAFAELKEQYPAALKYCSVHKTIGVKIGDELPCCIIAALKAKVDRRQMALKAIVMGYGVVNVLDIAQEAMKNEEVKDE